MVFLTLDDVTGSAEVVVFNSVYAAARELCVTDRILVVKGRIDHKQEGETKLIALEVTPFEASSGAAEVRLRLDASKAPAGIVRELQALLQDFPGERRSSSTWTRGWGGRASSSARSSAWRRTRTSSPRWRPARGVGRPRAPTKPLVIGLANLTVRFLLELLLAALAWWELTLDAPILVRILVGLAAPAGAAVLSGGAGSRREPRPAQGPPCASGSDGALDCGARARWRRSRARRGGSGFSCSRS